jgi:magnesium chelatase family protein
LATNPCADVYQSFSSLKFDCTDSQKSRYYSKISGPLLDRIDIQIEVPEVKFKDIVSKVEGESPVHISEAIQYRMMDRYY